MKKQGNKKAAPAAKRPAAAPKAKAKTKPIAPTKSDHAPPGAHRKIVAGRPVELAAAAPAARVKLVRDSFTMPREDFELVVQLKARALEFMRPTRKSELLRAGLQVLAALSAAQLQTALASLRPLPPGRPKKRR